MVSSDAQLRRTLSKLSFLGLGYFWLSSSLTPVIALAYSRAGGKYTKLDLTDRGAVDAFFAANKVDGE
jgi:hypothetical protein